MREKKFPSGILPVLPVPSVEAAADFCVEKLGFGERFRQPGPDGVVINAQVSFEDSTLMLNRNPEQANLAGGGVYFWIRLFDTSIDEYYQALQSASIDIAEEIRDQFWGDRSFVIRDCNRFHLAFNQAIQQ